MALPSSASIQELLDRMTSSDEQSKIVAIDELINDLYNNAIKLDEDSERKITGILLFHIEDESREVKTLAIRCLSKLVSLTKMDRIRVTAILKSCLHALDSDKVQVVLGIASIAEQIVNRWSAKFEVYDWDLIINICDSFAVKLTKPSSTLAPFTGHPQSNTNSTPAYQLAHAPPFKNSTTNRSSTGTISSNHDSIQSSNNISQYAMNLSSAAATNISDLIYHHNNHGQSTSPSGDNLPSRSNESLEMIQSTLQRLTMTLLNESTHGNIFGCDDALYNLIEKHYHLYDETIIIGLLEYRTKIVNTLDERYISNLSRLITKSFKNELRKAIRLKSIAALSQIFSTHRAIYEDELMEKIFIPNFLNADQENDLSIRKSIVYLLLDFASMCFNNRHCLEALKIIKKILVKPFKFAQIGDQSNDLVYIFDNADIIDSRVAIRGLTKIFKTKLFCLPIDPAIQILEILLDYLYQTYKHPLQAPQPAEVPLIRQELFSLLLILRANENCQLGLDTSEEQPIQSISEHSKQVTIDSTMHSMSEHNRIKYSPFLICKKLDQSTENMANSKPSSPTLVSNQYCSMLSLSNYNSGVQEPGVVDLQGMFTAIVDCINLETDYDVLRPVLEGLPELLANRSLVLSAGPGIIDNICRGLSDLIRLNPDKFNKQYPKNNMRSLIYKAMTSLIYYKKELETKHHKTLLVTFEEGLRLSQTQCISIITMCLIEMHESLNMMRFLPQILMKLSKFSATVHLAPCQLDFLSYLILFPRLCENFAGDEYICIFAIALPFTNPFKFNEYVISMAHRVIAMWFLKCRPTFRKDFVEYIKRNLQSHVIQPFKENAQPAAPYPPVFAQHNTPPHPVSATTSPFDQSRKRSLSLNTENSLRSRFEYRQSSIGSALISSQVPSSPPPNSPSSPSAFSFNNSDPAALGYHQTNQASSKQLNEELIETCTDLISRYTHGQCSAIPHKNPCADYLIDRNNSQTWLHGNSLITISTSRCNAPSSHGGLCDKCFKVCRSVHNMVEGTCRGKTIQQSKTSGEYSSMSPTSPKSPTFPHSNESRLNSSKNASLMLSASSSLLTPRSSTGSAFNSISSDSETEYGSPTSDSKVTPVSLSSNQTDSRAVPASSYVDTKQNNTRKSKKMEISGHQSLKNKHSTKAIFDYHHNQIDNSTPPPSSANMNNPCNCWCQGWAEILIRRPTGNTCWLTRLQNTLGHMPPISQTVNNGHTYNNNLTSIFNTMSLNEVDETSYLSESDTVISQEHSNQASVMTPSAETSSQPGSKNLSLKNQRRLSNPDPDGMSMSTTIINSTSTIDSGANSNAASQTSLIITTTSNSSSSARQQPLTNSSSPIPQDSDIGSSVASSSIATPTSTTTNGSSIRDRSSTISVMSPAQQHLLGQRTKNGSPNENLAASTTIVGGASSVSNTSHNQQITLSDLIAPQTPAPKSHGLHPSFVQLQFFNDCGINTGLLDETTTTMGTLNSTVINNNINPNQNQNMTSSSTKLGSASQPRQQMKSEMILLPKDSKTDVALKVFDRIQPYETHKIGVVYVGGGQSTNRTEILANKHGSRRYVEFLRNLGTLINLSDIDTQTHFIGGLDVNGSDGQFTYFWQDSITQIVFHVATLMPIRPNDLQCNEKIRHIGNDHVCIVYNDSGKPFELITIKGEGQCIIACIEITPVEMDTNLVTIKALPDLAQIIPTIEPKIVTNEGLSLYTRQTAIHLNLASMIYERRQRSSDETILNKKEPYVSNWVERLRKIKAIRRRVEDPGKDANPGSSSIMMTKR